MYIQLTRLDRTPIWINAAFVVTVEPRKGGGAIVVPIGDGLDYDVCETPEAVLALLDGAPAPAVVPVPAPKGLAPTREPPASAPAEGPKAEASEPAGEKPAKRTRRTKKAEAAETGPKAGEGEAVEAKPARKTRARAKKPAVEFPDDQIDRLKKMMPGSMRKLLNTLVTQFKVADAEAVVGLLQARGIVSVDREHVVWNADAN